MPVQGYWGKYESKTINSIKRQIENKFIDQTNMIINLTWFGPHFLNSDYYQLKKYTNTKIDNLFFICSSDPIMITPDIVADIVELLGNPVVYKLGNFDDGLSFNFFSFAIADNFVKYQDEEIILGDLKYIFLNYNLKPREHRVNFVKKLIKEDLLKYGMTTIGKPNTMYDNDPDNKLFMAIPESQEQLTGPGEIAVNSKKDFGIPADVLSLGNREIWQTHFLNIVSETEFNPWDNIFVSEKTWKPIIGLRPFLLNGNIRTYQWLRDNGFKTFTHYFNNIETAKDYEVHDSIINSIKYLISIEPKEIQLMYADMLPDLHHNKHRFFEFAREQNYKVDNLLI